MAPAGPRGRFLLEAAAVLAVVAATRWPLAPKYLYYFDSVNFALALDDFDPRLHQPQPPGYPLYVGLARLVHWFVAAPEHVFVITGIIAAAAALLLLRRLGDSLFGAPAGLLAAAPLLFNPPFWLGGMTNQVRLFLAAGAVAVAWLAWRNRFYAAAAALGIAAGFRPMMLRMERHCLNAQRIAAALGGIRDVRRVLYPGLSQHCGHETAASQMRASGGMVTIELDGDLETATRFCSGVKIFSRAESLGGVESLCSHPATMTHAGIPAHLRQARGIGDTLVRLSVGIEDVNDLLEDIRHALTS